MPLNAESRENTPVFNVNLFDPCTAYPAAPLDVATGFTVDVAVGSFAARTTATTGETILRSGRLAAPTRFYAYVRGQRESAFVTTESSVEVSGEIGYLPQDTHSGEDTEPVLARILSARGLRASVDGCCAAS